MQAMPTWESLRYRVELRPMPIQEAQRRAVRDHYLERPVAYIARPFAYAVLLDGEQVGFQIWARPHFTHKHGLFGPIGSGEPTTHWQWLNLSRLWIQDDTPPNIESMSIRMALRPRPGRHVPMLEEDYLAAFPPVFPDQPFRLAGIITWADTSYGHTGTIYQAAGFEYAGESKNKGRRHAAASDEVEGVKRCYVLRLRPRGKWQPRFRLHPSLLGQQLKLVEVAA